MALIKPFRAVRYNDLLLTHAGCLMTPPYDVISDDRQEYYYDQSPFNVIRLILGKEFPDDDESHNRYTRARDFLEDWLREGVLETENDLSIYGYSQIYRDPLGKRVTRDGFVALLRIEEWGKGTVYPHERTSLGPKEDRLRLVRATGHQMSFIFSLYSDEMGETAPLVRQVAESPEVTRYPDADGVEHVFTRCTDRNIQAGLVAAMDRKKIFIADGHHRYETLLAFRDELEREGVSGDGHRYAAVYFTPLEGEAVTILPCHRIVALEKPIDEASVVRELGRYFTVEPLEKTDENTARFVGDIQHKGKGSFGFYPGKDRYFLLTVFDPRAIERFFPANMNELIRGFDVSVLHHVVIVGILGIKEPSISYSQDAREALGMAREGRSAVFLVNPAGIEEVKEASLVGERMPAKSTYFYPKLASGLAFYRMVP